MDAFLGFFGLFCIFFFMVLLIISFFIKSVEKKESGYWYFHWIYFIDIGVIT